MKTVKEHLENIRKNTAGMGYADLRKRILGRMSESSRAKAKAEGKEPPTIIIPEELMKKAEAASDEQISEVIKTVLAVLEYEATGEPKE